MAYNVQNEAHNLQPACRHCGLECKLLGFEEMCPAYAKRSGGKGYVK